MRLARVLGENHGQRLAVRLVHEPRSLFRVQRERVAELVSECDVLILVKAQQFRGFDASIDDLRDMARRSGTVLVSHPCDGVDDMHGSIDRFTATAADAALALSRYQAEAIRRARGDDRVYLIGHASRIESDVPCREPRPDVRTVIWENPVQYNRGTKYEMAEPLRGLEQRVSELCRSRGARLRIACAWEHIQPYEEWLAEVGDADIAIECKALERSHTGLQLQKPAVKVLNYMALGLPTICDSLPAYRDLEGDEPTLLFADTLEEWRAQLELLFDDFSLRATLGKNAYLAAQNHTIHHVIDRLALAITEILGNRVTTED